MTAGKLTSVRQAVAADADAVARIYNPYIADTIITFEEQPVSPEEMATRITEITAASLPWLVAEHDDEVVGYAYASKWKGRCSYRFSVETTVYLRHDFLGRGCGTRLYEALLERLRGRELHVAIGGVALPNAASVALHEKLGFRKVAHFPEVGCKFGKWIDVAYWQIAL